MLPCTPVTQPVRDYGSASPAPEGGLGCAGFRWQGQEETYPCLQELGTGRGLHPCGEGSSLHSTRVAWGKRVGSHCKTAFDGF